MYPVSLTLCSFAAVHTHTDVKQFGEDGYGAKASKVLLAVRGKDFRHEKTKKKRGSYKGGTISLDSVSFKYSD
ncbi:SRP40, C-terminal domain-containing protein [Ochromonadaceae sp. CCMP2298]|nr:SRP40, C-terminal domain-containing protein [Ochromonadaceae sp. CCMP2298]